jgi:IclR family acetate operon transcriptional repressor
MSIVAVERALILLRYITDNEDGLSIREASRNFGYNPATVQKIVNAFKAQGYVVQDEITDRYHLGPEAVQLGLTALSRLDVRRAARPYLEELSRDSGETVFLAIARGNCVVYVDKVVSDQPIRMDAPVGADRPYNCTAVGKVLLAGMTSEEIEGLYDDGAFEKRTQNSILDADEMHIEVEKVREQGWARDREEFDYGASCVAAPIYDHEGQVVAALTVSGPSTRINQDLDRIIDLTKSRTEEVSKEMGYNEQQVVAGAR